MCHKRATEQKNSLPSACSRWQNAANLARPLLESLVWLFLLKSMLGESLFWPLARLYLLNPQLFFSSSGKQIAKRVSEEPKSWQFGNVSMLGGDWRSASSGSRLMTTGPLVVVQLQPSALRGGFSYPGWGKPSKWFLRECHWFYFYVKLDWLFCKK